MNVALWIVQVLLAALFLFSGVVKLMMPLEDLVEQVGVPGLFLQFVSVMEILGGLGLVLPGLLKIKTGLTPLAAACLALLMLGAVVLGLQMGDPVSALMPGVIGLLAAFVAWGRWRLVPCSQTEQLRELQAAR